MPKTNRLLVASDHPSSFVPIIAERFPDLPVRVVQSIDEIDAALRDFDPTIILGVPGEPLPKPELQRLLNHESVQWFSNCGAGIDHLGHWDVSAKTVTNAAGVNAKHLAQFTIACHMQAHIGLPTYTNQQKHEHWEQHTWTPFSETKMCVVGLGNVGRAVAAQAKHFEMTVTGTRGTPTPTENVDAVFGPDGIHQALDGADFVSVHAALTPATRGLVGDAEFAAMKSGTIFYNAARGPVVDEDALLRALETDTIKWAILDVFDTEPLPKGHPLWSHPKVTVTPHVADTITTWRENMCRLFCDNLERWQSGQPLINVVDPTRGY